MSYEFGRNDPYAKTTPQTKIAAPTPPPIDEGILAMIARKMGNQLNKTLGPTAESVDAFGRAAGNAATFGLPDIIEGQLGSPAIRGPASSEATSARTASAREAWPKSSAAGDAAGAAAQAIPASKLLGTIAPALGKATAGSQAGNQALVGGGQAALHKVYESVRDDQPINPSSLLLSTVLGTGFGGLGGYGASKLAGMATAAGKVAQTLPEGLSAAERTAVAQQVQRAAAAGADIDLPTAMRLAGIRNAPTVERQFQRGMHPTGEPVGQVPRPLAERITASEGALSAADAETSQILAERLTAAQKNLTRADAVTAERRAAAARQADRDLARADVIAKQERAQTPAIQGKTSPRIEEIRKQVHEEGKLGMIPNPPKGYSPDIYEEVMRRLTDLGETNETNILQRALEKSMPASAARRQAAERAENIRTPGRPSWESRQAADELERLRQGFPPSAASREAADSLRNLNEVKDAITTRPAAPEPAKGTRGREFSASLGGWGAAPSFRYRGPGGAQAPGPTTEAASRMMQDEPVVASGLLGQVLPWQRPAGIIPAEALRAPIENLAEGFFGLRPPVVKKRKAASP